MKQKINQEILKKMILSKLLCEKGKSACLINDIYNFSMGILILHDACDLALNAVASKVHAQIREKTFLMDYFSKIEDAVKKKQTFVHRSDINNLNTLRKNIKHQGIFADPTRDSYLSTVVEKFLKKLCKDYFRLDFETLSLKDLVKNQEIRKLLDIAEEEMKEKQYKEALESMAKTLFLAYDYLFVSSGRLARALAGKTQEEENEIKFPNIDSTINDLNLLKNGINSYLYNVFKQITPRIGKNFSTNELVVRWDEIPYGHPGNWTKENVSFCFDFLIGAILKIQEREEYRGFTLTEYFDLYFDVVEAIKDNVDCWDKPEIGIENQDKEWYKELQKNYPPPTKIFILKKEERISGFLYEALGSDDCWMIINEEKRTDIKYNEYLFIKKTDVKVTRFNTWKK